MEQQIKKTLMTLIVVWIALVIYIVLYYLIPAFQTFIENGRNGLADWATSQSNVAWMLLMSLFICFIGSASIGIPIPFPLVLFVFGDSIYNGFLDDLGTQQLVFQSGEFWGLMIGCILLGGFGSALGEATSWLVGRGIKGISNKKKKVEAEEQENKGVMNNLDGLGKILKRNPKAIPLIIFLFALTPLPDDILFVPLGLMQVSFLTCIIPGWLGKNFNCLLYMFYPIFIGTAAEAMGGDVLMETIILGASITIILLLMNFDWNQLLPKIEEFEEKRKLKKAEKLQNRKK